MLRAHLWIVMVLHLTLNGVTGVMTPCRFTATNEIAAWLEEDGSLRFPFRFQDEDVEDQGDSTAYAENNDGTICIFSNVTNNVTCKDSIDFKFLRMLKNQQVKTLTVESYNTKDNVKKGGRKLFNTNCVQKITGELILEDVHVELTTILSLRKLSPTKLSVEGEVFSNKIVKIGWKYSGEVTLTGADTVTGAEVILVSYDYENGWDLMGRVNFSSKIGIYDGNVTYKDDTLRLVRFRGGFDVTNTGGVREFNGNLDAMDISVKGRFLGYETGCLRTRITIPRGAFSDMTIKNLVFKDSHFFGDFHRESFEGINQLETIKFRQSMMELMPEYESIFRGSTLKAIYIENCNTPSLKTGLNCNLNHLRILSFKGSGFLEFSSNSFLWLSCSELTYLNLHEANIRLIGNGSILHPVGDKLRYIDLSYSTLTEEANLRQFLKGTRITHLSLAGLHLKRIPGSALEMVASTLKYLSLRGNHFQKIPRENMLVPILNFPQMELLRVLDLASCHINYIDKRAFELLTNLEMLDLSRNQIVNLHDGWVDRKPNILHLNLSYNDFSSRASAINLIETIDLSNFERLLTLDLSYSNFWRTDRVISILNSNLRYLSLCNCGLKSLNDSTFQAMENIEEIDLSGNPYLGKTISMSQFKHMRLLRKLHLAHNEVANLTFDTSAAEETWKNLEYIDLSNNYIKMVDSEFFKAVANVKILKLSHNSICFWPDNLVRYLPVLQEVFLDNNKIEKLKSETVVDFAALNVVSLGNNPYVCDHFVLSFMNIMKKKGSQYYLCPEIPKEVIHGKERDSDEEHHENRSLGYEPGSDVYLFNSGCAKINDWNVNEYHCFSQSTQKVIPFHNVRDDMDELRWTIDCYYFKSIFLLLATTPMFCLFFGFLWWKWWNYRMFTKMMTNSPVPSFSDVQECEDTVFEYDAFVSYSHSDHHWVSDNLVPNLESLKDVKICLHERDFQVGLSILENIATSIEKSRRVILVITQAFLRSQWCRFEMNLAYHRLLENRRENKREHMILIFLENIPRNIRPETLCYLMVITTYIQWPGDANNVKDLEMFWNRLFNAFKPNNHKNLNFFDNQKKIRDQYHKK